MKPILIVLLAVLTIVATILLMPMAAGAASTVNDPYDPFPVLLPPPPPPPILDDAWIQLQGDNLLFGLFFTHQPDYAHERFQWFLSANEAVHPMVPLLADFIVRSDDIQNGNVTVCAAHPYGGGCAGGWGIPLGDLATEWDGDFLELTFTAPLELFGGDSTMSFDVMAMIDGAQNDFIHGTVSGNPVQIVQPIEQPITPPAPVTGHDIVFAPETSSLWLVGLSVIALFSLKRRIH